MKILIYSVYGADPAMTAGAVKNAELAKSFYPDWESIFVLSQNVARDVADNLIVSGAVVEQVPAEITTRGQFWDYWLGQLSGCTAFQVRDCRNRVSARESAAVGEWLGSGKRCHLMRDHPLHESMVTPGAWGALGTVVPEMQRLAEIYSGHSESYSGSLDDGIDGGFTRQVVWPVAQTVGAHEHDTFGLKPFPECCEDQERFVGEPFDAQDQPDTIMWRLRAAKLTRLKPVKKACGCRAKEELCPAQ